MMRRHRTVPFEQKIRGGPRCGCPMLYGAACGRPAGHGGGVHRSAEAYQEYLRRGARRKQLLILGRRDG